MPAVRAREREIEVGRARPPRFRDALLTIIKTVKAKRAEVRALMVGLDNAGKTTIVKRRERRPTTSTISPTLGFNIKTMSFRRRTG